MICSLSLIEKSHEFLQTWPLIELYTWIGSFSVSFVSATKLFGCMDDKCGESVAHDISLDDSSRLFWLCAWLILLFDYRIDMSETIQRNMYTAVNDHPIHSLLMCVIGKKSIDPPKCLVNTLLELIIIIYNIYLLFAVIDLQNTHHFSRHFLRNVLPRSLNCFQQQNMQWADFNIKTKWKKK